MKDLRSTNRAFTQVTRPLGQAGRTSVMRPFAGTLQPSFAGWMRNHLGLTSSGWFRPVGRYFQKPKNTFELLRWPGASNREVRYTFSPAIRLTCLSTNTNSSLFKSDGARLFQTLTLRGEDINRRIYSPTKTVALNPNANATEVFGDKRVFNFLNNSVTRVMRSSGLQERLTSLFSRLGRLNLRIAPSNRPFSRVDHLQTSG